MFTKLVLGISLLPAALLAGPQPTSRLHKDAGYMPITSVQSPADSFSGQTIGMTVYLQSAPAQNQTINLAPIESNAFSSIPTSMVVPAGQTCGTVYMTISSTYSGEADVRFGSGLSVVWASTQVYPPSTLRTHKDALTR